VGSSTAVYRVGCVGDEGRLLGGCWIGFNSDCKKSILLLLFWFVGWEEGVEGCYVIADCLVDKLVA